MDYVLIDALSQMEIFVFRSFGPKIVKKLSSVDLAVSVFIVDPLLTISLSGLVVAIMLAVAAQLRFQWSLW